MRGYVAVQSMARKPIHKSAISQELQDLTDDRCVSIIGAYQEQMVVEFCWIFALNNQNVCVTHEISFTPNL